MRINPVGQANTAQTSRRGNAGLSEGEAKRREPEVENRLPATTAAETGRSEVRDLPLRRYRPNSVFVTQLIAVRDDWPDVRMRRRAEPEAAIALYREAEASPRRMQAGRVIVLSV